MTKPFRIAVLADLHVPDIAGSAQAAVFDWALETLRREPPDLLLLAGDMTAVGTATSAARIQAGVASLGIPYRSVPGNADVRTAAEREASSALLTAAEPYRHEHVVVLSLAHPDGHYTQAERDAVLCEIAAADGRDVVIMAHYSRGSAAYDWLQPAIDAGAVTLHIAGHSHNDRTDVSGACAWHMIRGLDPDKGQGASPAIATFTRGEGWQRGEICYPGCDPASWTPAERAEFRRLLGFSTMSVPLEGLAMAREEGVRCVELRAQPMLAAEPDVLAAAIASWRELGDTTLSIHMPDVHWRDGAIAGTETWNATLAQALVYGAQALTIHPPRASVAEMREDGAAWCAFRDFIASTLRPAIAADMTLSIENLHTIQGADPGDSRHFGCLPSETLGWIACLRRACPGATVGHHFDNGHARNNPPFSSPYPIGTWLATIGHEISGYHLHQVAMRDGHMINHVPVDSVAGGIIVYHSLFWAWHTGQIRHAPTYIEVRGGLGSIRTSLHTLRAHLGE